jgi:hypothetical protein
LVENLLNYGADFLLPPDKLRRDGVELVQPARCVARRLLEDVLDCEAEVTARSQAFG